MGGRGFVARMIAALTLLAAVALGGPQASAQTTVNPPDDAVHAPPVPLDDAEMWRKVREGATGRSSLRDENATRLVQAQGQVWRNRNNALVKDAGLFVIGATVLGLGAFLLVRGRIRMSGEASGKTVERFGHWPRMGHWLLGLSFILLALSGFVITYGRFALGPSLGAETFALVARVAKLMHDFVGFAFIVGLAMMVVHWGRYMMPDRYDIPWLARAGGLFGGTEYPPAGLFHAGQKLMFWLVVLGGLVMAASGLSLLFPFFLNDIYGMQAMQLSHVAMAVVLIAAALVHLYFATMGTQGTFRAAATGRVDRQWAKAHHSAWFGEVRRAERAAARAAREARQAKTGAADRATRGGGVTVAGASAGEGGKSGQGKPGGSTASTNNRRSPESGTKRPKS